MASAACRSTKPVRIGGATVRECGGGRDFWVKLRRDLLIIPQQGPTHLYQSTLRHRTPSKTQVILGTVGVARFSAVVALR